MTTGISVGRKAELNINSQTICFGMVKLQSFREIVENTANHICGDNDPSIENVTKGRHMIMGQIVVDITQPNLDVILPLLGVTVSGGDSYELGAADDVVSFAMDINMVGSFHAITGCYTASWGIMGQKGGRPVRLVWNIVGSAETEAGSFTPAMIDFAKPFAFTHTTCTISGAGANTARPIDRFQVYVDNGLVTEHNNSVNLTDATPGDRRSAFITSVPYAGVHDDLHWTLIDDDGGKQSVLTLNNTIKTVTITMPKGLTDGKVGPIEGKGKQIRTPVSFNLFKYDAAGTRTTGMTIAITAS